MTFPGSLSSKVHPSGGSWGAGGEANRYNENVIKKVVGKARLSYDELVTVICEIKNLINSRPLTYLTEENYQTPLSPYHLLYGWNINDRNKPLTNIETNQTSAIVRVKIYKLY